MITMVEMITIQETTVEAATAEVITMEVHPVHTLQSVQTGDNANVIMWAVLLVAAVAVVGAVVIIRRKNC